MRPKSEFEEAVEGLGPIRAFYSPTQECWLLDQRPTNPELVISTWLKLRIRQRRPNRVGAEVSGRR